MATRIIPTDMNDQNKEEPSRYVRMPFLFSFPYLTTYINTVPRIVVGSLHFVSHVSTITEQKRALYSTLKLPHLCESGFCLRFVSLFFI